MTDKLEQLREQREELRKTIEETYPPLEGRINIHILDSLTALEELIDDRTTIKGEALEELKRKKKSFDESMLRIKEKQAKNKRLLDEMEERSKERKKVFDAMMEEEKSDE